MAIYAYFCQNPACEQTEFDLSLPMSQYDSPQVCPECNQPAPKLVTAPHVIFAGDDWASKNERVRKQQIDKNKKLDIKMNERKHDAPGVRLAPNVNGERVETWSDAQKLAKASGKNTASYDKLVRKESAPK